MSPFAIFIVFELSHRCTRFPPSFCSHSTLSSDEPVAHEATYVLHSLIALHDFRYSDARDIFIETFGISKGFSLSVWLRESLDHTPFAEELAASLGALLFVYSLVANYCWLSGSSAAGQGPEGAGARGGLRSVGVGLGLAILGTVLFAIGTLETVFSTHFGTRELIRYSVVIGEIWVFANIFIYLWSTKGRQGIGGSRPLGTPPTSAPRLPRPPSSSTGYVHSAYPSPSTPDGDVFSSSPLDDASEFSSVMTSDKFRQLPPKLRERFQRKISSGSSTARRRGRPSTLSSEYDSAAEGLRSGEPSPLRSGATGTRNSCGSPRQAFNDPP